MLLDLTDQSDLNAEVFSCLPLNASVFSAYPKLAQSIIQEGKDLIVLPLKNQSALVALPLPVIHGVIIILQQAPDPVPVQ